MIEVNEKIGSRETGTRASDWRYTVIGTADHAAAVQALYNEAVGKCGTWQIENLQVEPVFIDEGDPDACIWEGTVTFVPVERKQDEPLEAGQSTYQFDTGGGSAHIIHIKNATYHKQTYPKEGDVFDPEGLIGATAQGEVEGCDIMVPVFNWSETHIIPDATVTEEYKGKIYELTARTNAAVFRGFAIGECLFAGASGSQRGDDDWEMTFRFASSQNVTEATPEEEGGIRIKIRGVVTAIVKKGWEYIWLRLEQKVDGINELGPKVRSVYVEQVYESGDFGELGIGE